MLKRVRTVGWSSRSLSRSCSCDESGAGSNCVRIGAEQVAVDGLKLLCTEAVEAGTAVSSTSRRRKGSPDRIIASDKMATFGYRRVHHTNLSRDTDLGKSRQMTGFS
ncbi:hypothetical protein PI125_g10062 [Phytophthora idaei]|nr:hypothetical protein PI125_g10062 [Phytophthora idaei]